MNDTKKLTLFKLLVFISLPLFIVPGMLCVLCAWYMAGISFVELRENLSWEPFLAGITGMSVSGWAALWFGKGCMQVWSVLRRPHVS